MVASHPMVVLGGSSAVALAGGSLLLLAAIACGGQSASSPQAPPKNGEAGSAVSGASSFGGANAAAGSEPTGGDLPAPVGGEGGMVADPFAALPEVQLEAIEEITLAGFAGDPTDIYVDPDGIRIVTLEGHYLFDFEGQGLSSAEPGTRAPAAGIDGRHRLWTVTVIRDTAYWYDSWEDGVSILEGVVSASGVGSSPQPMESGTLFVSDAARASLSEHTAEGTLLRELLLEGTELQGLAFASDGALFALDARRSRMLRLNAGVTAAEAVAPLPNAAGSPSGIHFFDEGQLYVCYRNSPRISVLRFLVTP